MDNYYTEVDVDNAETQTEFENNAAPSETKEQVNCARKRAMFHVCYMFSCTLPQESQSDKPPDMHSQETNTEIVEFVEKGINTRSRGLTRGATDSGIN